jgi:hypothetical protein
MAMTSAMKVMRLKERVGSSRLVEGNHGCPRRAIKPCDIGTKLIMGGKILRGVFVLRRDLCRIILFSVVTAHGQAKGDSWANDVVRETALVHELAERVEPVFDTGGGHA